MSPPDARFTSTRWSLVAAAADSERAREALGALAQAYWYPLYAYARRLGVDANEAEDVVQGFFARLLATGDLAKFVRGEARFRSFLRAALRNFVANHRAAERAAKRGGDRLVLAADCGDAERRFISEAEGRDHQPEREFEHAWARELVARALASLEAEYRGTGRSQLFETLRGELEGRVDPGAAERAALAPGAWRVAVHRIRRRFREALLQEVTETVRDRGDAEAELQELLLVLSGRDFSPDP